MLAEEAHKLGARVVTLDPAADAPAARVADGHIVAAYDDGAALEELCRRSDVVTYEFENVPGEVLIPLVERYNIPQGFQPLYDSQDRLREKRNAVAHGLRTPRFAPADDRPSLEAAVREAGGFPCVFKTRTLGYDGYGQVVLRSEEDMAKVEPYFGRPGIVEEFVAFDFEASAIVVGDGRETVCFPVGRNVHRDGILDLSVVPAEIPDALRDRIVSESRRFMQECGYRGILCDRVFRQGRRDLFQRNGAAPAQQRALDDRGMHDQPVPRTGALPAGDAVGRAAVGGSHGDEEYPGARFGRRRGDRPGGAGGCPRPSLRQTREPPPA